MSILTDLLPTLATALGGPLAGVATKWVADKIGASDSTVTAVTDALQGIDPSERIKLEQEFNRWLVDQQNMIYMKEIEDKQSARVRDSEFYKNNTRNYRADFLVGICLLIVFWLTYLVWTSPNISEFLKGIVTLLLGRFLGYLDNIFSFEFGSTRSGRTKDETIKQLTKEN
jgi:hypothetical protein